MASDQVDITRVNVTQQGPVTDHLTVSLEKTMRGDPSHDIPLQMNDYIMVQKVPEWDLYKTVKIQGEVLYPGTYTIKKGDTLSSLVTRAGGYTDHAYLKGAVLTRESVRQIQQQRINEMADRLERELYSKASSEAGTSLSAGDAQIVEKETAMKGKLLAKLRGAKAQGRIVIRMEEPEILKGSVYDIELEEGDTLTIPRQPWTVQVIGSVLNSSSFIHEPKQTPGHYIRMAGGYAINADAKRIYVIRADGSAVKAAKDKVSIEPGDTVVVPEKIQITSNLRQTRDIVDILYKVAVSAAVLID